MKFTELPLAPFIQESLQALNFNELTEVQEAVIPAALKGRDLIVQSQTGSGKSHSFLLPLIERIDPSIQEVQGVITAPSRELAEQLYQACRQITEQSPQPIQVVNYIGGTDKARQINRLQSSGQPHIVIGTPGRIFDLMRENALWVQTTRMLVIDEADMTFDLGFLSIVDEIASRMPENLQMMAFSATIPQEVDVLLRKYMNQPMEIEIEAKEVISNTITNYLLNTKGRDRKALTYQLLTMGNPYLALVFTNTKQYADEVSQYLKEQGLKVATIHGDVSPRERKRLMRQIRNLEFQYVVATDLAARGIDIPGISLVINTELPKELEFFVHRVGRTGRNQLEGTAITFITPDDDEVISTLEDKGIQFQTVELRQGELVEVEHRHRRKQRQAQANDDPVIRGMIKRNQKRKVKPGYKKKLNREIQSYKRQEARRKQNQQRRAKKKANREKYKGR